MIDENLKKEPGEKIESVKDLIYSIESFSHDVLILYRGQDCFEPLFPKIARRKPAVNTGLIERTMLEELKRRTVHDSIFIGKDDWDCLVYAQHYGLATRLLDWTTNALVALWYAACDLNVEHDGYVYLIFPGEHLFVDKQKEPDPFSISDIRVLKPNYNNPRIAAQNGWFTVHPYSEERGRFIEFDEDDKVDLRVLLKSIAGGKKLEIIRLLDMLGVNHESIYPDIDGMCQYLNWKFEEAPEV